MNKKRLLSIIIFYTMASYAQTSDLVNLIKYASNRIYCACEVGEHHISEEKYNQLTEKDKFECDKEFLNRKFDEIIAKLEKDISFSMTDKTKANTPDKDSSTPLMLATITGFDTIVQMLIEHGANVQIKDKRGLSALDYYDIQNVSYLIGWMAPMLLLIEGEFFERNSHARCAELLRKAKCPSTDSKELDRALNRVRGTKNPLFLPVLEKARSCNLSPLKIIEEMSKVYNQNNEAKSTNCPYLNATNPYDL